MKPIYFPWAFAAAYIVGATWFSSWFVGAADAVLTKNRLNLYRT